MMQLVTASEFRVFIDALLSAAPIFGLECPCCDLHRASTRKYPGLGYYCDACMYGLDGDETQSCFAEDVDAQDPTYYKLATGDRTNAVHARIGSKVRYPNT